MRKPYALLLLILSCMMLLSACHPQVSDIESPRHTISYSTPAKRILLLPLDSRPACTAMVSRLAAIGNMEVILPPDKHLDHYHQPADRNTLRSWLQQEIKHTDTVIVSADMLLHGSLLHSRKNTLTEDEITSALQFLRTLRHDNPKLKLYVFNTIPRLLIADDDKTKKYQKDMLKYSTLQEEIILFNQENLLEELKELEENIPPEILAQYHRLYHDNRIVNEALLSLVEDNTIDYLVVGQDDGHVFGLPNIVKEHLDRHIKHNPHLADRTQIVRGADELAMLLVSRIYAESHTPLSVYVTYNDEKTGGIVMPFMSQSVNTTVNEKLASIPAIRTNCIENADYVLYVYIGSESDNLRQTQDSLATLCQLDAIDKPIALVDLSEHFRASETLLPTLLDNSYPINRLIAYAGWNTASNAIGTAVAQASLYANAMKHTVNTQDKLSSAYANLTFLNDRFLDDYYYMKLVQPYLKLRLQSFSDDSYQLSPIAYYKSNDWLTAAMTNKAHLLYHTAAYQSPFKLVMAGLDDTFIITDLAVESSLPWERIFEANIFSKIIIKNLQKGVDISP